MKKIAIFASGTGSNAENLAHTFAGDPQICVDSLFCDRENAPVIEKMRRYGVPVFYFPKEVWRGDCKEIAGCAGFRPAHNQPASVAASEIRGQGNVGYERTPRRDRGRREGKRDYGALCVAGNRRRRDCGAVQVRCLARRHARSTRRPHPCPRTSLPSCRGPLPAGLKRCFNFLFPLILNRISCILASPNLKTSFSFVSALDLHYLCD